MARRELGPAALKVAQAVRAAWPAVGVVLGVSGGADSMALAAGAAWVVRSARRADDHGIAARALIVDHGLQDGSGGVAAAVADRVRALGLPAEVVRVDVHETGQGPEAAARVARLDALGAAAGGGVVMLGHTLDDQAESVLLGLARGSGLRSLAGMRPVSDDGDEPGASPIVRPLLGLRREVTVAACREWGLQVWDDPHNTEERFARVRVRRSVLPVLEAELGPGVAEALARTADLARADADALDALASAAMASAVRNGTLDCCVCASFPAAIASRVVRHWLLDQGASEVASGHVTAVLALITDWRGQGPVQIPGVVVERCDAMLVRSPAPRG